jgi:NAD(P)-dependent dehydrogenase (short-subunit alcohol dehydrogenase family)
MGGLTGLINNAAITNSGGRTMDELALDMWDLVMDVNVRGTWLVTQAAHPHLARPVVGGGWSIWRRTRPCGARLACSLMRRAKAP